MNLLDARAWKHRLYEYAWKATAGTPARPRELTWPVDPNALKDLTIRWPREYAWKPRGILGEQVRHALMRFLPVELADIPQPYQGVVNAEIVRGGRTYRVMWETSDYADLNETAYADADLYFKMEYAKEGYGQRDRLFPAGYVSADKALYTYLPRLRQARDHQPPLWEVYGRYGLSMEKRRKALEILRSAKAFTFYGGEGKVRYSAYLREVARARICIDLPSMSSITFRCIDLLAVGSCIVGPPHTNQLLKPMQDGVHVTYCRPDYEDLEAVCAGLLADEPRRRRLEQASRDFFDRYVHRDQQASFWLQTAVTALR